MTARQRLTLNAALERMGPGRADAVRAVMAPGSMACAAADAARGAVTCAPVPPASADWELLLDAVAARLRDADPSAPGPDGLEVATGGRHGAHWRMSQCATALDQLHGMLVHEFGRQRCLCLLADRMARARAGEAGSRRPALALLAVELGPPADALGAAPPPDRRLLLPLLAARLSSALHAQDRVLPMGEDLFGCLLADGSEREPLRRWVHPLSEAAGRAFTVGGQAVVLQATIGLATTRRDGESAEDLLARAEAALARTRRLRLGYTFLAGD